MSSTLDIRREIKQCPACARRFSRDAAFCPFDGVKLVSGAFTPLADPLLGAVVDDRYEVVDVLGEGGMGRVYRVCHTALGRHFAMKVLRRDLAQDEGLAERFIHEAKATASVKHPNIVQITDFGHLAEGTPYFVMDLLAGQTLGELVKDHGPIPSEQALSIVRQVADALGAAHAAGIVHRDLKPDNIFLVDDRGGGASKQGADGPASLDTAVRVVDFGAAKIVGSSRITRTGVVFGTPHYMSPEQAGGQPVDHRADVYALGVIMYEMFTGRVPFEADTYMGVLTQHMFLAPVPPSQVCEAARNLGELEGVILKCLAKRPEDRFVSMAALARAIDQPLGLSGVTPERPLAPSSAWAKPFQRWRGDPSHEEPEPPTVERTQPGAGAASRQNRESRLRQVRLGVVAATLSIALIVAWLAHGWHPSAARGPAETARAVPEETTSPAALVPAAPPPSASLNEAASSGPAVASAAAASSQHPAARRPAPRRPPAPQVTVDDVGDPFAAKR